MYIPHLTLLLATVQVALSQQIYDIVSHYLPILLLLYLIDCHSIQPPGIGALFSLTRTCPLIP